MIGSFELIIIIVVAAVFFFGKDKIIDWAKSLGGAKRTSNLVARGKRKKAKRK